MGQTDVTAGPAPVAPSPRLSRQGLLAAAGVVAAVTLVARAVGLVRWFVFSKAVGATCVGQVYMTANQVPNVLFEVAAGGALAAVAVPLVSAHLQRGDEQRADRTASALLTWSLTVLLPLAALVALAAGPVTLWLLGTPAGCDPQDALAAARLMLVLFAPQVVLYGVGIVLTGVLQAHRRFLAAAVAPLLSSVVVIGVYVVFAALHEPDVPLGTLPAEAVWLLAGGTTVGVAALTLPLLLPAARLGVRWRPTWRFPEGTGRRAGALALAGVAVVGAQQLAAVVILLLANAADGVATITVWTYAQTAYLLPYAVLVVPLATVAFPRLTGHREEATGVLRRALVLSVTAAVVAAAVLVAVRDHVGAAFLLLDAGADGPGRDALDALPLTLAALAPGLVGYALVAVGTRALYAVGSPRRAAAAASAGWAVAALLPLLLVPVGADARDTLLLLAVGSSVGMSVAGMLLVVEVVRAWGGPAVRGVLRGGAGALGGAAVGALAAELLLPGTGSGWLEVLGRAAGAGTLVLALSTAGVRLLAPRAWKDVVERLRS
ncbi:lipid II flippase MurJ [Ornithinimicrobium pekingense]|uniref:Membrane protein n=1 Tax=Ornithinimicrobium pekingense TaxID=384677 RepID=A0ABQ2F976_9MICO|nr:lipid II flippase MurJ [Ornithinimicrobium pekingense]GGK74021.1 membrane protein [Ornithinimicrobium pekingense]